MLVELSLGESILISNSIASRLMLNRQRLQNMHNGNNILNMSRIKACGGEIEKLEILLDKIAGAFK